jgi:hypothetical protein
MIDNMNESKAPAPITSVVLLYESHSIIDQNASLVAVQFFNGQKN